MSERFKIISKVGDSQQEANESSTRFKIISKAVEDSSETEFQKLMNTSVNPTVNTIKKTVDGQTRIPSANYTEKIAKSNTKKTISSLSDFLDLESAKQKYKSGEKLNLAETVAVMKQSKKTSDQTGTPQISNYETLARLTGVEKFQPKETAKSAINNINKQISDTLVGENTVKLINKSLAGVTEKDVSYLGKSEQAEYYKRKSVGNIPAQQYYDSKSDKIEMYKGVEAAENYINGSFGDKLSVGLYAYVNTGINQAMNGIMNSTEVVKDLISENGDFKNQVTNSEYANAYLANYFQENDKSVEKAIQDIVVNISSNMTTKLLGTVTGSKAMGLIPFALSAFGNAYKSEIDNGYTKKEATLYALSTTATETAGEVLGYLLSGMPYIGGFTSDNLIENLTKNMSNKIFKAILNTGGNIASEYFEEKTQYLIDPILRNLILNEENSTVLNDTINQLKDSDYSGFIGAMSALFMSGISAANEIRSEQDIQNYGKMCKTVLADTDISVKDLAKYGLTLDKNSDFYELSEKITNGKIKETDYNIGKLFIEAKNHMISSTNFVNKAYGNKIKSEKNGIQKILDSYDKSVSDGAVYSEVIQLQAENIRKKFSLNTDIADVDVGSFARNIALGTPAALIQGKIQTAELSSAETEIATPLTETEQRLLDTPDNELTPDGSQFDFFEKRDIAETAGQVQNELNLSPTDNISNNTVPQKAQSVNNNISTGAENNSSSSESGAGAVVSDRVSILKNNTDRRHTTLKEQEYIKQICEALGIEFEFGNIAEELRAQGVDVDSNNIPDGYIDGNNVIHIGWTVHNPVQFVLKHELTHFCERKASEEYKRFTQAVEKSTIFKDWLKQKTKLETDSISKLEATYRQMVIDSRAKVEKMNPAKAQKEMFADFVADCIFTENGSGLESLINSLDTKDRPVVIQYILDFLLYIKNKLSGNDGILFEISRLEDNFNRMLSEAVHTNENNSVDDNSESGNSYSFVLEDNAETIAAAEQRELEGASRDEIWQELKIIRNPSGNWLSEINDSEMKFVPEGDLDGPELQEFFELQKMKRRSPEKRKRFLELFSKLKLGFAAGRLKDYVSHDELFKKYPFLKEIKLEMKYMTNGSAGRYDPFTNTIIIDKSIVDDFEKANNNPDSIEFAIADMELRNTLIHEMQHAIQEYEDRDRGSNIEYWQTRALIGDIPYDSSKKRDLTPFEAYLNSAGEIEARAAENRLMWDDTEREEETPDLGWDRVVFTDKDYTHVTADKKHSVPTDTEYMSAVKRKDTKTVQNMVDKAAKAAGYTERLYHQTGADFTEFNTEHQKAGKYDWELPTGTFLKPSSEDIGLSGKKQMELYAQLKKPLLFKNRQEAQKFWKENINGYTEASEAIANIDEEYGNRYSRAEGAVRRYTLSRRHSDSPKQDIYSDTEFRRLYDQQQQALEEWEMASDQASLTAKKLIDDFIAKNDYDGIILEKDQDGDNKSTKSYIVFNSNQLKTAAPVTYDDSGNVIPLSERFNAAKKDIRYSFPVKSGSKAENRDFTVEMASLNQQLQNGDISQTEFVQQVNILYNEAGEEYGTIKKGETVTGDEDFKNPVPKSVDTVNKTRQYARTIIEGGKLTEDMLSVTKQMILSGDLSYTPTSNEKNLANAHKIIQGGHAEDRWNKIVNCEAMPDGSDIAMGEVLLKLAVERKDTVDAVKLIAELAEVSTRLGQSLQALSLLKRMDGVGQLYYLQKCVNTLNNDLQKKYKSNPPVIVMDETLAQQLAISKTEADFEITYGALLNDIAAQVPATFLDKFNAWRYMAMLFNPITHIRNFKGNAVFLPAVKIKDIIAYGGERFINQSKRTKSVKIKKEYKDFAERDFEDVKEAITDGGKMNPKRSIADNKPIFKTKWLESIRKFNSEKLEEADIIFLKGHYKRALGGYLQARGINLKTVSPSVLVKAREYAILEAQKATYRDASVMANWLAKGSQKSILGHIVIEGTLPFKKTSANVLKRGVEYSPIGLITTVGKAVKDFHSGDFSVSQFIDGLASNLTGTGIFALGMWLAASGIIKGGSDGDDEDWFDKMLGRQDYSVEIGGISYTVDWMAPACIPFFMGVSVMEGLQAEDNTTVFANILDGFGAGLSPIIELSMLSGIQGALETVRYSKPKELLPNLLINAAESYFLQVLPTLGGKIANLIDPVRRTNYIDKTSPVPEIFQSVANKAASKIPFASTLKAEYINAWGEQENKGNFVTRLFQNFISPGYLSSVDIDNMEAEIKRLAKSTGDMTVFPDTAPKYIKFKGITKHLNREDYEVYAVTKGQMSADYIKEAVESSKYQGLTDEQKVKVINNLYKLANAKAKSKLSYTYEEVSAMHDGKLTEKQYNDYSSKTKQCIVEDYFFEDFQKALRRERNGGSAVEYYINLAKKDD